MRILSQCGPAKVHGQTREDCPSPAFDTYDKCMCEVCTLGSVGWIRSGSIGRGREAEDNRGAGSAGSGGRRASGRMKSGDPLNHSVSGGIGHGNGPLHSSPHVLQVLKTVNTGIAASLHRRIGIGCHVVITSRHQSTRLVPRVPAYKPGVRRVQYVPPYQVFERSSAPVWQFDTVSRGAHRSYTAFCIARIHICWDL